jgi:hypothetical protein
VVHCIHEVLNLNVELYEDGMSDAETCRTDIRVYLYISKVTFVGVMYV